MCTFLPRCKISRNTFLPVSQVLSLSFFYLFSFVPSLVRSSSNHLLPTFLCIDSDIFPRHSARQASKQATIISQSQNDIPSIVLLFFSPIIHSRHFFLYPTVSKSNSSSLWRAFLRARVYTICLSVCKSGLAVCLPVSNAISVTPSFLQ